MGYRKSEYKSESTQGFFNRGEIALQRAAAIYQGVKKAMKLGNEIAFVEAISE